MTIIKKKQMSKVLLLNPPVPFKKKIIRNIGCSFESKANYLFQPQDLLLISSFFPKNSYELLFWDYVAHPSEEEDVLLKIKSSNFDLIIMMMADCIWTYDLIFLKKIRNIHEKTLWLAGDAFLDEENRQNAFAFADAYIPHPFHLKPLVPFEKSEGILPLDTAAHYHEQTIVENIKPRHHLFIDKVYRWPFAKHKIYTNVFASWGCPNHCSYCPSSLFRFQQRTLEQVIEELKQLKEIGIREFYLGDRSFGFPLNDCLQMLKRIKKEKFDFSWSCYFHPNNTNEELLREMKECGCHTIIIGIEHHKQEKLHQYKRAVLPQKFDELFKLCKKYKMDVCGDFLIGLPDQNTDDIKLLTKLACSLPLDYASFNLLAPLPGTTLREEIKNKIPIDKRQNFDSLGKQNTFSVGKISVADLTRLRNTAIIKFYARPSYLFKRVIRIKSFEHFLIQFEEMLQLFKKIF